MDFSWKRIKNKHSEREGYMQNLKMEWLSGRSKYVRQQSCNFINAPYPQWPLSQIGIRPVIQCPY